MTKKRVCVCGHFGFGHNLLNGQTVKTKILTEELERALGVNEVQKIDTSGKFKAVLRLPFTVPFAMMHSHNLVILPAYKGIRLIAFLIAFWKIFFRHCTIHYTVVGAWLPRFMSTKPLLRYFVRHSIDYIYAETSTMKEQLCRTGIHNVLIMPNCKKLDTLRKNDLVLKHNEPLRLCTFSRIMKMKGIVEAADVVKTINKECGRTVFTLDIYGPVWPADQEWFDAVQTTFSSAVRYCGMVEFSQSVNVLKKYFMLIFPTRFATEGVPGTLIDAYAAGLPVLAARWESFADVVNENVTGLGYTLDDYDEMKACLMDIATHPDRVERMRVNCIEKAAEFVPESVCQTLIAHLK